VPQRSFPSFWVQHVFDLLETREKLRVLVKLQQVLKSMLLVLEQALEKLPVHSWKSCHAAQAFLLPFKFFSSRADFLYRR
jgi:hypothetical protein